MSDKETDSTTNKSIGTPEAGSAPELPHEVAKQYGLHHDHAEDANSTSSTDTGNQEAVTATAEATTQSADEVVDDPKTEAAVDDILAKESDQLLTMQGGVPVPKPPVEARKRRGLARFFAAWWRNKWARYITIFVLLAAIAGVFVMPKTRYAVLNQAGVRSSASVVVLDNTTQLPLKNVSVTIGSAKQLTNHDGTAKFTGLKLGDYQLAIKRVAFAPYTSKVTIGWGSNPLGSFKIKATGTQYVILVKDFINGDPIAGAEATTSDDFVAQSDKDGKITLTVDDTNVTKLTVTVSAAGYRSEPLQMNAAVKTQASVNLILAQKDVFVSKQSGKYDVFTADLDGRNRKLLLAGTGNENSTISLVVSPDGKRAALVSTRDNLRDADGFLLQALTIINIDEGTGVTVDHAEQIQLVDWVGNRLVYRMTLAGASAANSQRNRLISYNYDSNARIQLATANQFNAIVSNLGYVYYTVSSTDPHATLGLFRIKTDGSDRKRLSEDEIWTALRTGYETLSLQTPDGWSGYDIKSGQFSKTNNPSNVITYLFANNSKGDKSVWMDVRDGNGTLLLHDNDKNTDKALVAQGGLTYPLRWVSDKAIIYRLATSAETADYVIGANGRRQAMPPVPCAKWGACRCTAPLLIGRSAARI